MKTLFLSEILKGNVQRNAGNHSGLIKSNILNILRNSRYLEKAPKTGQISYFQTSIIGQKSIIGRLLLIGYTYGHGQRQPVTPKPGKQFFFLNIGNL